MTHHSRPSIVGLCGSRREGSHTLQALKEVRASVIEAGGEMEIIDLSVMELPPFDPEEPAAGDGAELINAVGDADAIILATPMYHGSYSGVLKNAIDYCGFDEFEGKTIGLLAVSGGAFPLPALEHLRTVGRSLKAWVLPHQAAVPFSGSAFDREGIKDEQTREFVWKLGRDIVKYANVNREPTELPTRA